MNPRHAVALALVGWYLISPPLRLDAVGQAVGIDQNAPLPQWFSWKEFSTREGCEAGKPPLYTYAKSFRDEPDPVFRYTIDAMLAAKCVFAKKPTFEVAPPN